MLLTSQVSSCTVYLLFLSYLSNNSPPTIGRGEAIILATLETGKGIDHDINV